MSEIAPLLKHRFFDANGDPLAGGKLHTYIAGTTTNKATYTDVGGATANANPIILDSSGYCELFLGAGIYKMVLKDSDDATIFTSDNVQLPEGTAAAAAFSTEYSYAVTDGQSAADLNLQSFDGLAYSSVAFDVEILRGTTVAANMRIAMQYLNGTWRVVTGVVMTEELHGVTFSVSQATTIGQLKAATDGGAGIGTIKMKRSLYGA